MENYLRKHLRMMMMSNQSSLKRLTLYKVNNYIIKLDVDDVCFYAYEECNYQGRAIRLCGRFPFIPP